MSFLVTRAAVRHNKLKPAQETWLCWPFTIKWLIGQKFFLRRYLNGRAKLWRQLGLIQIRLVSKEEKVRKIIKSRRYRVTREETLHFLSKPWVWSSLHTSSPEGLSSSQVGKFCAIRPDYFPEEGSNTDSRMGPVANIPGSLGQEQTLSNCSYWRLILIFLSFSIAHFICKNVRIILCLYCPDSGGWPDLPLGYSLSLS